MPILDTLEGRTTVVLMLLAWEVWHILREAEPHRARRWVGATAAAVMQMNVGYSGSPAYVAYINFLDGANPYLLCLNDSLNLPDSDSVSFARYYVSDTHGDEWKRIQDKCRYFPHAMSESVSYISKILMEKRTTKRWHVDWNQLDANPPPSDLPLDLLTVFEFGLDNDEEAGIYAPILAAMVDSGAVGLWAGRARALLNDLVARARDVPGWLEEGVEWARRMLRRL